MKTAFSSGQAQQASELAHKMSPPCRHLGAIQLCNLLKQIEDSLRNNEEPDTLEPLLAESILEFAGIKSIIEIQITKIA